MTINNIGYNCCHDKDFFIDRPDGSGDNLLLLIKSDAVFTIDGKDVVIPENSLLIFRKNRPQVYRCMPESTFSNDWIHFLFDENEEERFLSLGLSYETPIKLDDTGFCSFCIKSIANEVYSDHRNKQSNILQYMFLMLNHASEYCYPCEKIEHNNYYELLSAVRNRIYSTDYHFFSVESSAHEVRMSKSNFQHLYKRFFGVTFVQDLINSRIERAKLLLMDTDMTCADIARECGYSNFAHFTRQFKDSTGMTANEFRSSCVKRSQKLK